MFYNREQQGEIDMLVPAGAPFGRSPAATALQDVRELSRLTGNLFRRTAWHGKRQVRPWDESWDRWAHSAFASGSLTAPLAEREKSRTWLVTAVWLGVFVLASLPWIFR